MNKLRFDKEAFIRGTALGSTRLLYLPPDGWEGNYTSATPMSAYYHELDNWWLGKYSWGTTVSFSIRSFHMVKKEAQS